MMEYKGFVGIFEYDDEADLFHGQVANSRDVITFQGRSIDELKLALRNSIDVHLGFCHELGEEPDKPFPSQYVPHFTVEFLRQISLEANRLGKSPNAWVEEQLRNAVSGSVPKKTALTGPGPKPENGHVPEPSRKHRVVRTKSKS